MSSSGHGEKYIVPFGVEASKVILQLYSQGHESDMSSLQESFVKIASFAFSMWTRLLESEISNFLRALGNCQIKYHEV